MKTIRHLVSLLALSLFGCCVAQAADAPSSLTDSQLLDIKFEQKLNQQVSPELSFRDESGREIKLGDYFGGKPVILVLGYYGCPMLCTLTLNGVIDSLQDLKRSAGKDFVVVNVSIDPAEKPGLAAAKKAAYLKRYARDGAAAGWHFLTGDEPAIHRLTDETGFHYAYDPAIKQYAHPGGFIVLAPDGRITRYFFGVTYSAQEVSEALDQAGAGKVGSPIEQFFLLCFHYSPLTGKYGKLVLWSVRVGGVLTVLCLAGIFISGCRRPKEAQP